MEIGDTWTVELGPYQGLTGTVTDISRWLDPDGVPERVELELGFSHRLWLDVAVLQEEAWNLRPGRVRLRPQRQQRRLEL